MAWMGQTDRQQRCKRSVASLASGALNNMNLDVGCTRSVANHWRIDDVHRISNQYSLACTAADPSIRMALERLDATGGVRFYRLNNDGNVQPLGSVWWLDDVRPCHVSSETKRLSRVTQPIKHVLTQIISNLTRNSARLTDHRGSPFPFPSSFAYFRPSMLLIF